MRLYQAVQLASKQPPAASRPTRVPNLSTTCSARRGARPARRPPRPTAPPPSPASTACSPGPTTTSNDLTAGLPHGRHRRPRARCWASRRGRSCSRRPPANFSHPTPIGDPSAQFFVLKDNVALRGNDITNPQQSTDPTGQPDVTFGFSGTRREGLPERHRRRSPTAAAWSAGSGNAQPALRGGARQPADHGPVDRLQAVPGRDQRRQRRRHHRRLHDQLGARTWPTSCGSAPCRSTSS